MAWIGSVVGELRSHMPVVARKKKKRNWQDPGFGVGHGERVTGRPEFSKVCLCGFLGQRLWGRVLLASSGFWASVSLGCGCITPGSASVVTWPSSLCECPRSPLIRTPVTGLGPTLVPSSQPDCVCQDPVSREAPVHTVSVGHTSLEDTLFTHKDPRTQGMASQALPEGHAWDAAGTWPTWMPWSAHLPAAHRRRKHKKTGLPERLPRAVPASQRGWRPGPGLSGL